ncbi:MAG: glycosyltransferase [Candidatus Thiodiazotropha sp. (ex Ctena orbiculata)]|nr:glycosyltransferase [Candidatus Thiodiazotropha taylori]MBT2997497.1 glycosyltransferase [Candidatus Thiodiazotropha taylori]MBT3001171.1 glycosyltransferase [Candidatus Thiodiazotropha taylori]MBV2112019.1 glycosyltransferase [Candidatus Thiodiazotropha taylori]
MINVLHLRDTDRVCGPGKTIIETCSRINKEKYNLYIGIFVRVDEEKNKYQAAAEERGITVLPIVMNHKLDLAVVFRLIKIIKRYKIDVLHSHEYKSDIIAFLAAKLSPIKIVSTAHGWIENSTKSKMYLRASKNVLKYFNKVIAVSPKIRNELLKYKIKEDKCQLIYNAIVIENYVSGAYEKNILRNRYKLDKDDFLIGNIGRLSKEKGQKDFVTAATAIAERHENIYFFLIGDGPEKDALATLINNSGLQDRIFLTGHYHDIKPVFQDLDAVGLTSYTEGFPNVLLESLIMRKPIFGTDVGGVRDIIIDQETGQLIQPNDIAAITDCMEFIINNPDECKHQVTKGVQLIEERYDFKIRINKIEKLYSELF